MYKLTPQHNAFAIQQALHTLAERLRQDTHTTHYAPALDQLCQKIKTTDAKYQQALRTRDEIYHEIQSLDQSLDREIDAVARAAYCLVHGNRDDVRYQMLFPTAPGESMRDVASAQQEKFVCHVVTTIQNTATLAPLLHYVEPIQSRLQHLCAALEKQRQHYIPYVRTMTELYLLLDEGRRLYNGMYQRVLVSSGDAAVTARFFAGCIPVEPATHAGSHSAASTTGTPAQTAAAIMRAFVTRTRAV